MPLTWSRGVDEFGRPVSVGTTPTGETYRVDGHGYGRMRWTCVYPDGDYVVSDTRREAVAMAEHHAS